MKGVSLEVDEGEIVTLIGANGAGKSTALQTVSGLLRPRGGLRDLPGPGPMQGVPADKLVARGLAQVPEGRRVFLQMTVEENLEMGAFTQPKASIAGSLEEVYRTASPGCRSGGGRWPGPSPAASSRCWPWGGP